MKLADFFPTLPGFAGRGASKSNDELNCVILNAANSEPSTVPSLLTSPKSRRGLDYLRRKFS